MSDNGLLDKQRDVQRKLGRCLLLLQQYELMAKHLVAHSSLEGSTIEEMQADQAERLHSVANRTLGQLAKDLAGNVFQSDTQPDDEDHDKERSPESFKLPRFRTTSSVSLPAEDFDSFKTQLDELVLMRNALVHHFLQRFNVFNEEGCEAALAHLDSCATSIEHHVTTMKGWLSHKKEAHQYQAALFSHPKVQALFEREFAPEPPEDLGPEHPLVVLLRQAEGVVAKDGWTLMSDAIEYIAMVAPGETPKKHKVRTWQQVFRRSRGFEIKKDIALDSFDVTVWYRSAR